MVIFLPCATGAHPSRWAMCLLFLMRTAARRRTGSWRATALSSSHAVVGAFYRIPPYSSWLAKSWYGYDETEKHGPVPFVPSGDLIVRKATFFAVGGFDETLETNEDYDFCNRAQKAADLDVIACPDLAVTHFRTPQTIGSFYRKQRWHGKHVFAVTLRNWQNFRMPERYRLPYILCAVWFQLRRELSGKFIPAARKYFLADAWHFSSPRW